MNMPEPTPLPVPPDFPVEWDSPEEKMMFWEIDGVHAAGPMPLLSQGFAGLLSKGFVQAGKDNEMPVTWKKKFFHRFEYTSIVPAVSLDQMEAQGMKAMEKLGSVLPNLKQDWEQKYLPEVQECLSFWESFDLAGADMPALMAHFEQTAKRYERLWHIHFLVVVPVYFAISQFDELYQDLFEQENALGGFRLLQGFDNKTLEADRALWTLSQQALQNSTVKTLIESNAPHHIIAALSSESEAQAFMQSFHEFMEQYGQRANLWGLDEISWIEDPTTVLKNLKEYVMEPPGDPLHEMKRLADARDKAIAEAQEKLQGYPQQVQDEFNNLLPIAQYATVLSEDHGFWIDFRANYKVRCVIMEIARRFAEVGALKTPQNIFHLSLDQVRQTAQQWPLSDAQPLELTELAGYEKCTQMTPAPALGSLPPGPPPDDPIFRTFAKFFGVPVNEGPPAPDATSVKGHSGSSGTVRGPARVILSLDDADKLKEGDIMVTRTTAPPWTSMFATAAAVVTDAGGVLCHCAVVAREYGIPAVVGTQHATAMFKDGQMLEVDGDTGQVSIV
jgi:pyruvate,water dikinase